jgi:hypothetical protein
MPALRLHHHKVRPQAWTAMELELSYSCMHANEAIPAILLPEASYYSYYD